MRELRELVAAFDALAASGGRGVLATVVHVEGSTYRRPGARALLLPDDRIVGLLSGGCLEGDLLERARRVREDGAALRVRYDHRGEDDLVWGLGLGCAGLVDVLLQPVSREAPGPLPALRAALAGAAPAAVATVIAREGEGAPALGATLALEAGGECEELLSRGRPRTRWRAGVGFRVELLEEPILPPVPLAIFGAGPDVAPVVRLALELGFEVRVVDPRPALARPERFPGAEVVGCDVEEAPARVPLDARSVALVMTHHYLHDKTLLRWLLATPARYVGVLGPRQRTEDLLRELREEGFAPSPEALERLHGPAGLDLGGDGPEPIALALLAEIVAVLGGRSGGSLRERKGPIHDPLA